MLGVAVLVTPPGPHKLADAQQSWTRWSVVQSEMLTHATGLNKVTAITVNFEVETQIRSHLVDCVVHQDAQGLTQNGQVTTDTASAQCGMS